MHNPPLKKKKFIQGYAEIFYHIYYYVYCEIVAILAAILDL